MNPNFKALARKEFKLQKDFQAKFGKSPILPRFQTPEQRATLMEQSLQDDMVHPELVFSNRAARVD